MAIETVQAVRQVELKAAQMEREALLKKESMIAEAEQNAKALITSMTKQALDNAGHNLSAANQKGNKMLEEVKLKAENEVLVMKEMAQRKEQTAINLVLSCVIQDN